MDSEEEKLIKMIDARKRNLIGACVAILCILLWIFTAIFVSAIHKIYGGFVWVFGWAVSIFVFAIIMEFVENGIKLRRQKDLVNRRKLREAENTINQYNKY